MLFTYEPSGIHLETIWCSHGNHIVSTWKPHGVHADMTWFLHGYQVFSMWRQCGYPLDTTQFQGGYHVVSRCTSCGFQVHIMWFSGGHHVISNVNTTWFPGGHYILSTQTPCGVHGVCSDVPFPHGNQNKTQLCMKPTGFFVINETCYYHCLEEKLDVENSKKLEDLDYRN